ncbi:MULTISPECIES: SDR family NAD(P)-dependent oxidoreductase [unclassified Pseudofrankia]|uniref:SDR family NAD(P)-dependent oxidoreductase n=1 Tax=unclassified Pseudofrankia TaxID=2994372 RepID=UPI0008D8F9E1|nr:MULTISPECIES: SDR family NAD(P)-dependent oxidoreductase [unclassified Pseudofrankia]MDT3445767.1 SDR family NAD(P)-dependent oxidoreductase [Pseudofrankia sp. BMG5.37]OHV62776.1 short-chain dehydrogenase [Pseudofrankia sp. BMG5.36]
MSRVAVVTGGASGMGLSICEQLARRGDRVAVLDVNEDAAARAAEKLRATGAAATACAVDVADRASVDKALAQVRNELGPLEIMVTSAAIAPFAPFAELTLQAWERVLAVNLTGTFHCLQAAIPDMAAAGWGRLVTIASSAAQIATPNHAHYAASKGGVVTLTRAVALEYARQGITANVIAPHMIDTPMFRQSRAEVGDPTGDGGASRIPLGRLGNGDDIAASCLYLVSDEADYITGQVFGVNGGAIP